MNGPKTGAAQPQAGEPAQPQAGGTTDGQEPVAGTGQEPAAATQSSPENEAPEAKVARLERELADTRREAAANRTKAAALQRDKDAAAQAGMTEAERHEAQRKQLEDENRELKGRVQDQAIAQATITAATKLNYRNPELAGRLLTRSELEFDDEGAPKNVERLLRELAAKEPYLTKGAGAPDFGGGTQGQAPAGPTTPTMNELLRTAIKGG